MISITQVIWITYFKCHVGTQPLAKFVVLLNKQMGATENPGNSSHNTDFIH